MLDCIRESKEQRRSSRIQRLDSLLKDYKSEYHYLFACIYRAAKGDKKTKKVLEHKYPLPNTARRLLEAFLEIPQPGLANVWEKLEKVNFDDKIKKDRILQFVNMHSHGPGFGESDGLLLNEVSEVLNNILELIEHEAPKHYEEMKKLASRPNQNSG